MEVSGEASINVDPYGRPIDTVEQETLVVASPPPPRKKSYRELQDEEGEELLRIWYEEEKTSGRLPVETAAIGPSPIPVPTKQKLLLDAVLHKYYKPFPTAWPLTENDASCFKYPPAWPTDPAFMEKIEREKRWCSEVAPWIHWHSLSNGFSGSSEWPWTELTHRVARHVRLILQSEIHYIQGGDDYAKESHVHHRPFAFKFGITEAPLHRWRKMLDNDKYPEFRVCHILLE